MCSQRTEVQGETEGKNKVSSILVPSLRMCVILHLSLSTNQEINVSDNKNLRLYCLLVRRSTPSF